MFHLTQLPEKKMFHSIARKKLKDLEEVHNKLKKMNLHDKETEKLVQIEHKNLKKYL
jgi:hypothetical protein